MKVKKAILTGGGRGTRLYPLTATTNKHLLPLANKPMIFHAIERVVEAGITDIFINTNPGETQLQEAIGDGGHWGIRITYFEQTGGPQGIAHVVKEAEKFIGGDPFLFYLSDNILLGGVKEIVEEFSKGEYDCMLAFSQVEDPERFGIPFFDEHGRLIDVQEKPKNPPNNLAVTGIYLYGSGIFFDAFSHIERSARGEYEISSIHSRLLKSGKSIGWKEITGWWKDTGKPEDLLIANRLLLDALPESAFHISVPGFLGEGKKIHLGAGTVIGESVHLVGPIMIGENCLLKNCTVGPYVTIGAGCEISGATLTNSILLEHIVLRSKRAISESLFGKGALFTEEEKGMGRFFVGDKSEVAL